MRNNRRTRRQLTDAELRRALDYQVGDIVRIETYRETLIGPITDIKLSLNKQFLIYVVLVNGEKGPRFIQARNDQIHF